MQFRDLGDERRFFVKIWPEAVSCLANYRGELPRETFYFITDRLYSLAKSLNKDYEKEISEDRI